MRGITSLSVVALSVVVELVNFAARTVNAPPTDFSTLTFKQCLQIMSRTSRGHVEKEAIRSIRDRLANRKVQREKREYFCYRNSNGCLHSDSDFDQNHHGLELKHSNRLPCIFCRSAVLPNLRTFGL